MKKQHNRNSIYQVNVDGHSAQERNNGYIYNANDIKVLELDLNGFSSYYKYEIESLAFIPWSDGTFRIVFSANIADKTNSYKYDIVARIKKTIIEF